MEYRVDYRTENEDHTTEIKPKEQEKHAAEQSVHEVLPRDRGVYPEQHVQQYPTARSYDRPGKRVSDRVVDSR